MRRRGRPRHQDILTPREWEVLDLLREGLTNEQIGQRLGVTADTAKYHVSEILGKLGVESRQEAARWAGRRRVLRTLGLPAALLRRVLEVPAWKLAGGAVIAAAAVGFGLLAAGVLLTDEDASPEEQAVATSTAGPESLTGDEALDDIVESLLQDDAAQLAARFAGVTARSGFLVGGPVGFNDVRPVTNAEWTALLAGSERVLVAAVEPREPDDPVDVSGAPGMPSAVFFDGQRDHDVVVLARAATPPERLWRFSVEAGEIVDVIVERLEDDPRSGPIPLLYRIYTLMPSPDEEPGRFLVLPPEAYWPIPPRVEGGEPTPQAGREPTIAPDGRTGDPALDALIETLVYGNAAALEREVGELAARQENCIPIPDNIGACSTEYERISAADWIARFTGFERTLYAVTAHDPVRIVIAVDSGPDSAEAWRFGARDGKILDVEVRAGEDLPPGATPYPGYYWQRVRNYAPDPGYEYEDFLVLPPREMLPQAPAGHGLSVRTGVPGVDALLALLEAHDGDGLMAATAVTEQLRILECRSGALPPDPATVSAWAQDTAARAISVRGVSNVPEGYFHPLAQHVVEVVLEVNPLRWQGTAIMERDGRIVGLVLGGDCAIDGMSPGPRNYLVPPLDTMLQQFDSSRRSGVPIIDAVLDAMQSGDEAAWEGLIDWGKTSCGNWDYAPPCPPGVATGSEIDAIPITACHGGSATRDNPPRPSMGDDQGDRLYAVVGSAGGGGASILLVDRAGGATSIGVSPDGLSSITRGCGNYHPEWLTPQGEPDYVLPPPPQP